MSKDNLTPHQLAVFDFICCDMKYTTRTIDMCKELDMSRAQLHDVLQRLEKKGYIKVNPQKEIGARIKRV